MLLAPTHNLPPVFPPPPPLPPSLPPPLYLCSNAAGSVSALGWGVEYVLALAPARTRSSGGGGSSSSSSSSQAPELGLALPLLMLPGWSGGLLCAPGWSVETACSTRARVEHEGQRLHWGKQQKQRWWGDSSSCLSSPHCNKGLFPHLLLNC